MSKRSSTAWARSLARVMGRAGRQMVQAQNRAVAKAVSQAVGRQTGALTAPLRQRAAAKKRAAARVAAAAGRWTSGVAVAAGCTRRWRLYIPPGLTAGVRPPLLVLLHGCGQDAEGFAAVTAMHRVADRGGFLVLLPEQDRLANAQGCWNWFDTEHGRA